MTIMSNYIPESTYLILNPSLFFFVFFYWFVQKFYFIDSDPLYVSVIPFIYASPISNNI